MKNGLQGLGWHFDAFFLLLDLLKIKFGPVSLWEVQFSNSFKT